MKFESETFPGFVAWIFSNDMASIVMPFDGIRGDMVDKILN